ncbi:MAG: hypothetical protein ABI860_09405, partial [Gemmatimonadales bacterium]
MRTSRTSVAALVLLLAAGCARTPATVASSPSPEASRSDETVRPRRPIAIQVDNLNFSDMNVYLMSSGTRWLVGGVGVMTKGTVTIPASLAPVDQRVRLRAEAIG